MREDQHRPHPVVRLLSCRPSRRVFAPLMVGRTPVFMLHRLSDPATGVHGHSLEFVKAALEALRSSGAKFIALRQLVQFWKEGVRVDPNAVVFTIDDGFADQAELLEQVFVPLECPVTVFLISGFMDGYIWPWDDQLAFVFRRSMLASANVALGGKLFRLDLGSQLARYRATSVVRDHCKELDDCDPYEAVRDIARQLGVEVPATPSPEFRPMGWSTARRLERAAVVDFGPHSISHRIFSRSSAALARQEIETSWRRLQDELARPVPVFAWPTGRPQDFLPRDIELARQAGLEAAVSTEPDYALNPRFAGSDDFFRIRRFGLPDSLTSVLRYGSWLERGRQMLPI